MDTDPDGMTPAQSAALARYRHDFRLQKETPELEQAVAALVRLRGARVALTLPDVLALDLIVGNDLTRAELAALAWRKEDVFDSIIHRACTRLARHYEAEDSVRQPAGRSPQAAQTRATSGFR